MACLDQKLRTEHAGGTEETETEMTKETETEMTEETETEVKGGRGEMH